MHNGLILPYQTFSFDISCYVKRNLLNTACIVESFNHQNVYLARPNFCEFKIQFFSSEVTSTIIKSLSCKPSRSICITLPIAADFFVVLHNHNSNVTQKEDVIFQCLLINTLCYFSKVRP